MKTLFLFTLLLSGIFVDAQIIVCGKITNPKGNIVTLSSGADETKSIVAKLNKGGLFKLKSNTLPMGAYVLEHGDEHTNMFLYPNDSLYVTLNTKLFDETLKYSGLGAEVNNYLAKQLLYFENTLESQAFFQTYYTKIGYSNPATFCAYADSLTQVKLNYLNKYKRTLPSSFYDYQYAEIVYNYAGDKVDYPSMHYYVRGIEDSTVKVEASYYQFFNELNIENENYLSSFYFVFFLQKYIHYQATKRFNRDSISFVDQVECAKVLLKGNVKEKIISELILQAINSGSTEEIKQMFALSSFEISNKDFKQTIEKRYAIASALFAGNIAPQISLKTKEGKPVKLSDFIGKVVYLDFWASWCGPCMMEMPHAKILQDSFAKKDVVFLYVSVDESEKDWLNAMAGKKMKGVHVRTKGFKSDAPQKYDVNGIPSYFLIGRDGKIINNRPSRPSMPSIYTEINDALKID